MQKDEDQIGAVDMRINQFIWSGLHYNYLWADVVPELSINKYGSEEGLNSFLNGYQNHQLLFEKLMHKDDRYSILVEDYHELEDLFEGSYLSTGCNFQLLKIDEQGTLIAYILYVIKGSPAALNGLKRGDIITKIDGKRLNINNYVSLLNKDSYTLTIGTVSGNGTVSDYNISVALSAVKLDEDPIYLDTVYSINGSNVGYLVYNQFIDSYDQALNQVFANFANKQVQELILDLRYNMGGAVISAVNLASMIYAADTTVLFAQPVYNAYVTQQLQSSSELSDENLYLTNELMTENGDVHIPINSLKLKRLIVIASSYTASASELIINGLRAHIPVTIIGEKNRRQKRRFYYRIRL
ncbi:MAG: PDZ domain-containing protein [Bacteroidales bacterium]|nr:PDZ domain-containing protein [Bacteroidales bacterium]